MLSHFMLGSNDIHRAKAFYDKVLAPLGVGVSEDHGEEGWFGYTVAGSRMPMLIVGRPLNGQSANVGNGSMIAFNAPTRAAVDAFHAAALATGGTDEGRPGLRPHYHRNYYGAYVRDPDGNKLCCVCHLRE